MKKKKPGMVFTMEVLLYLVIVFVVIAGGMRYFSMNSLSGYKASIMMQQAESLDRALLKYGQMHRGVDKDTAKVRTRDGNKETFLVDRPPVYPATYNDFKNLRDYSTGYVAENVVLPTDAKRIETLTNGGAGHENGIFYYIPYDSKGNVIASSDSAGQEEGAYAFDLFVDLPDGTRYYTQNSKNRDNRGTDTR